LWGELGSGSLRDEVLPVDVLGLSDAYQVSLGTHSSCALTTNGTVRCWGHNENGNLGVGLETSQQSTPAIVLAESGGHLQGVTNISLSATGGPQGGLAWHKCLTTQGDAGYCWGVPNHPSEDFGQRGSGGTPGFPSIIQNVPSIRSVFVGGHHSCAVTNDDRLYCWGYNDSGQLGLGDRDNRSVPQQVMIPDFRPRFLALSARRTCALSDQGRVRCWGTDSDLPPFEDIEGLQDIEQITAGTHHFCARSSGRVYCWGDNYFGECGDGTRTNRNTPGAILTP
jgi:alpha-tubulin suppressor-like RCC1 family protein